jgi:pilus assembly protein FimV
MHTLTRFLMMAALLLPAAAGAAGLGQINVMSSLGQPLHAEIDVLSVPREDASTILVRLSPPDAYKQANVEYGGALHGVRVSLMQRANGQLYVRAYSVQPVNEPFLNLLIEISGRGSTLVRQYPVLLDPPGYASAPVGAAPARAEAAPAPAPAARAETRAAAPQPAPAAVATPAAPPRAASEYGPVKRGETLSRIAAKVKPEGVSLDQMLIAILRANPEAFINNNVNLLKAGATLQIPDSAQLAEVSRDKARQEVRVQIADWNRYRRKVADSAAPATEKVTDPGKRATVRVKESDEASKDVLKLSRGQPAGAKAKTSTERIQTLEEELIARDRALKEANARIQELEKTVKETATKK